MTSTYFDSIIEDFGKIFNSCISPCTKKWALTLPCLNDCSWSSHHHVIISFFISCPGKTWSHSPEIEGFHSIGHVWPLCFHRSRSKSLPDPSTTGLVCLAHTARHAAPTRKRRSHRAVLEDASNVHTQAIQQWLQKVIIGISALDRLFRSLQYQVDVGSCHQLFQKVKSLCWGASTVAYVWLYALGSAHSCYIYICIHLFCVRPAVDAFTSFEVSSYTCQSWRAVQEISSIYSDTSCNVQWSVMGWCTCHAKEGRKHYR